MEFGKKGIRVDNIQRIPYNKRIQGKKTSHSIAHISMEMKMESKSR